MLPALRRPALTLEYHGKQIGLLDADTTSLFPAASPAMAAFITAAPRALPHMAAMYFLNLSGTAFSCKATTFAASPRQTRLSTTRTAISPAHGYASITRSAYCLIFRDGRNKHPA